MIKEFIRSYTKDDYEPQGSSSLVGEASLFMGWAPFTKKVIIPKLIVSKEGIALIDINNPGTWFPSHYYTILLNNKNLVKYRASIKCYSGKKLKEKQAKFVNKIFAYSNKINMKETYNRLNKIDKMLKKWQKLKYDKY